MTSIPAPRRGRLVFGAAAVVLLLASCRSSRTIDVSATTAAGPTAASASTVAGAASTATPSAALAPLPPGSALPDDATCAARVTPAKEIRAVNAPFNARKGTNKNLKGTYQARVTGDFSGTTDEILQWGACKWGIPVDVVRAQAAKESYWRMTGVGDWTPDAGICPPGHALGVDGKKGQCPESIGILQVRWNYHGTPAGLDTWPDVVESTAYQVDYTYAVWRSCYEGAETWLNEQDKGATYAAGDLWGCLGVWFAGRWYTPPAKEYIAAVQDYATTRIWTRRDFIDFTD